MTTSSHAKFTDRLATAFALASTLFMPVAIFWWAGMPTGGANGSQWILYAVAEGIILLSVFIVAYPIERWLIRPNFSALHAAGYYFLVFGGLFLLLIAVLRLTAGGEHWFIFAVLFFVTAIGGIIAIIARLIYPIALRVAGAMRWVAGFFVLLTAASLATLLTAH